MGLTRTGDQEGDRLELGRRCQSKERAGHAAIALTIGLIAKSG